MLLKKNAFLEKKHDSNFPIKSIQACLAYSNLNINQIDFFSFYEKPTLKLFRIIDTYLSFSPRGYKSFHEAFSVWTKKKLFQKSIIINELEKLGLRKDIKNKLLFSEHHISHAASAYFPSSFNNSVTLTMDGVGEYATSSVGLGIQNKLILDKEMHFPHSLGLLYSAFTNFCGFKVNSGEYKLMGLAPYGKPIYKSKILNNLLDLKKDGSFRLNMKYFDFCTGFKMINSNFCDLFKMSPRKNSEKINTKTLDIAASIQIVLEDIVIKTVKTLRKEYKSKNLSLAGGVALNCVSNGRLIKEGGFENIWVQPASGDAGGALGCALFSYHHILNYNKKVYKNNDNMNNSYLGPSYKNPEVKRVLDNIGAKYSLLNRKELIDYITNEIIKQKVIGWFQGRMEFGPRALGNRSIIADPRSNKMQNKINLKIKFRESFRPFAPVILKEKLYEWFDLKKESKYMSFVAKVNKKYLRKLSQAEKSIAGLKRLSLKTSHIPAVTHVDNSARIQSISNNDNPLLHSLIKAFYKKTNCPVLVNTSFNVRGEPIVNHVKDAFDCFMETDMDLLVVNNFVLKKEDQDKTLKKNYLKFLSKD